jgi:hypothetical protein
VRWRTRVLKALPFTDNLVSVIAGLLAITTFAAGAFGYVAQNERAERNELEGTVASLKRQRDDLKETNDTLDAEVGSLRDENADLEDQIAAQADSPTTTTPSSDDELPPAEGAETPTSYNQIYAAQGLTVPANPCSGDNAVDLDVPVIGAEYNVWDVAYTTCQLDGKLRFAVTTRHVEGPANATAEQCADVLRRKGIGPDDMVAPLSGAVICVETRSDEAGHSGRSARIVRMEIKAVDTGERVTVNVEAWEPD